MKTKKTIGVLGGMGPEATAYFFQLLIKHTEARCDQDHIPILVWNNPRIPPRTPAILHHGESPLPLLRKGIRILEKSGAGLIVMPCITAHFYAPEIRAAVQVPFIDLLEESLAHLKKNFPGLKKAGLLASSGTVAAKLWPRTFEPAGIQIITPDRREQKEVVEAIFGRGGVKAGFTSGPPKKSIVRIARNLTRRGAEAVVAGCTEVPLVLGPEDISVPLIEPMKIAALACIAKAGFIVRESNH